MLVRRLTLEIVECPDGKWRIDIIGESERGEGRPKFNSRAEAEAAIMALNKIGLH